MLRLAVVIAGLLALTGCDLGERLVGTKPPAVKCQSGAATDTVWDASHTVVLRYTVKTHRCGYPKGMG